MDQHERPRRRIAPNEGGPRDAGCLHGDPLAFRRLRERGSDRGRQLGQVHIRTVANGAG